MALEQKVHEFDQASRKHNLEIVGIEQLPNENVMAVAKKLGDIIGVSSACIDWVSRRTTRKINDKPAPIIIGFKTSGTKSRDEWLANRRKLKELNSSAITGGSQRNKIFINEDLTKTSRELLWNAKTQLKERFKFIWVNNGKILVKKADGDKSVWVSELLVSLDNNLKKIDVIVVTEPNINYAYLSFYKINGFTINSFTRSGRSGGGVIVYAREGLAARVCGLTTRAVAQMRSAECVTITLTHDYEPIYIISIYRPPKINKQDKTLQFLEECRNLLESIPNNTKVIFCGDINLNLLKNRDKHVIMYEELLAEFGFIKCIDRVTRSEILLENLVESCLDHIFIRAPSAKIDSAVIHHKISDHYPVSVAVEWERAPLHSSMDASEHESSLGSRSEATSRPRPHPAQPTANSSRLIRVLDNRAVREKLLSTNFDDLLSITCPLKLYEAFRLIFLDIYQCCYSTKIVYSSNRNNKGWVTEHHKKCF
ncbi:unnamed protein product, partial [Brenthis ino]